MYSNFFTCPINRIEYEETENNHPIDVVYTWVDSSDSDWQKKKEQNKPKFFEEIRFPNTTNPDIELETSLLLTLKNMKWIRFIYIVTMRPQIPKCLHNNFYLKTLYYSGKIKMIFHDQLGIPLTFNSNVIECYLHKIPLLSENFIYFNDDNFVLKEVPKDFFFNKNKPITVLKKRIYITFIPRFLLNIYLKSVVYTFSKKHGRKIYCMKHHSLPYTLNKSFCEEIFIKYKDDIDINRKNVFRSNDDFLFYVTVYNEGLDKNIYVSYANPPFKYIFVNDKNLPKNIKEYTFLCMNNISEQHIHSQIDVLKELL